MFICDVTDLPKHAMFVLVTIASFDLMRVMAFFLLPLFVTLVINHLVAVLVGVEFVLMFLMVMVLLANQIKISKKVG